MEHTPSLERLERSVDLRDYTAATTEIFYILRSIEFTYGRIGEVNFIVGLRNPEQLEIYRHFASRFISSYGQLMSSPGFELTFSVFESLQQYSRWIELMSSLSGQGSTDHFIRRLGPEAADLNIDAKDTLKLLALYMPHSALDIPFEVLHHGHNVGFIVTALSWIGSRYCFNKSFFDLREKLLEWIVPRLEDVKLGEITLATVCEPYFHCSYAMTPKKHAIKAGLTRQVRRALVEAGAVEWRQDSPPRAAIRGKPVIVVTTEYINNGHSIYRTHSKSLRSLKESFHVVLVCNMCHIAGISGDLYDEIIEFPTNVGFYKGAIELTEKIEAHRPAAILHMAVGMSSYVVALASLRLAPVQFASYGHTSSTMSSEIDYMVLPEDFVADLSVFSEKILALPRDAMPYEPRTDIEYSTLRRPAKNVRRPFVEIGIPATLMKLNPVFFETLKLIQSKAISSTHFTFFPGSCVGLTQAELDRQVRKYLPDATINAELPYDQYCIELAQSDFTLNPFPYGNMNTIVEAVALGLPGVCMDGAEAHSHLDGALYARFGLPACLIADCIENYVSEAVRLIDDDGWREECRMYAASAPLEAVLYQGDENKFCRAIRQIVDLV